MTIAAAPATAGWITIAEGREVRLEPGSNESEIDTIAIDGIGKIGIALHNATGSKCGRCWHYRNEVQIEGDLCNRCRGIVGAA